MGGKGKYSRLRLPSPSVFLVYRVNGTYISNILRKCVNLESCPISPDLGEAIGSGNGSFDRE